MAWKFVQDNWDELYNRYEGGFLLSRLIKVKWDHCFTDQFSSRNRFTTTSYPGSSPVFEIAGRLSPVIKIVELKKVGFMIRILRSFVV